MSFENVNAYFKSAKLGDRVKVLNQSSATVQLAAEAVGCEVQQIAKTLSFLVDELPILIVAAGNAKIDNQKYKSIFHSRPKLIPRELVDEYVGHEPGGVCPFSVKPNVKIFLDISLKQNEVVYPGAGSESSLIELTIAELEEHSAYTGWVNACKEVEK